MHERIDLTIGLRLNSFVRTNEIDALSHCFTDFLHIARELVSADPWGAEALQLETSVQAPQDLDARGLTFRSRSACMPVRVIILRFIFRCQNALSDPQVETDTSLCSPNSYFERQNLWPNLNDSSPHPEPFVVFAADFKTIRKT